MAEPARCYPMNDSWNNSTTTTTSTTTHRNSPLRSHRYLTRHVQQQAQASEVTLRPLPFFDTLNEIIQLTELRNDQSVGKPNESHVEFKLSIEQADQIAMDRNNNNIILRFCQLDQSTPQDDNFPPEVVIIVNGSQVTLPPAIHNPNRPNVPPKRPGQHVDITKQCKLCPFVQNIINVRWLVDPTDLTKQYGTTIIIGQRVSTELLLQRIRERGIISQEVTKRLIADSDSEVATTNLQCPLLCPIGKMRMSAPCKSIKCQHLTCFDALCYLQMNERKPTWTCPVCNQPAYYPDLMIDGYFVDILNDTPSTVTEVTLNLDGTWSSVLKLEQPTSAKNPAFEVITISDDDD